MDLLGRMRSRWRRHLLRYHVVLDYRVEFRNIRMILIENSARVHVVNLETAESLKGTPKCRVLIQGLSVKLHCIFAFHLTFIDLPKQIQTSSTIRYLTQLISL